MNLFQLFIFESCDQTSHTHFWPCLPKKSFDQLWSRINMQKISLFHLFFLEIQSISESNWSHPFLTMLPPKIFNCLVICVKLYQQASVSSISSIIFPNFGAKKCFPKNLALSGTTSYGFLAPSQNSEKTNYTIPRKYLDRWRDGKMERQKDG